MPGNSTSVFTKQQRIAELAKRSPSMGFTSLAHLMDIDWLRVAFQRTRKDGAPGVDGQTWNEYAVHLEANLQSLLDRAKSGTYRAPPVRRVYIPKAGSATETRPIGIPTWRTRSFSGRLSCCWSRFTSRTLIPARMASGRDDRRTRPWKTCGNGRWTAEGAGFGS